jgi:ADP-ribose pyrophosphatase
MADARDPNPYQTLSSQIAFSCPYYKIRQDAFRTPGGHEGQYYVIEVLGGVWIIPLTTRGEIVLIRQYRYPVKEWCWELPAGGIRTGQTAEEVARNELREEIGGTAQKIEFFANFHTCSSISNEQAHIFIATGVELGAVAHEPTELLEVHPLPFEEVITMARTNQIHDARSALAILIAEAKLRELKKALGS